MIEPEDISHASVPDPLANDAPTAPRSCEYWYFDALSDDGREALVITFHDNYLFSRRYYKDCRDIASGQTQHFPAVTFTYSVDGRTVMRAINEFGSSDFNSDSDGASCSIGESSFRLEDAEYGSGFVVKVDMFTSRKRHIEAELEWLSVEANAAPPRDPSEPDWRLVAPRSDVSGRVTLTGRGGNMLKTVHFRGTGYHDRQRSETSRNFSEGSSLWGRAHFTDLTAIFRTIGSPVKADGSRLYMVEKGELLEVESRLEKQNARRSRYGVKVPRSITFDVDGGARLEVKPLHVIQSGFFQVRVICEITMARGDDTPHKTWGIAEIVDAPRMKNPILRWISDLSVGKNGRPPLF